MSALNWLVKKCCMVLIDSPTCVFSCYRSDSVYDLQNFVVFFLKGIFVIPNPKCRVQIMWVHHRLSLVECIVLMSFINERKWEKRN